MIFWKNCWIVFCFWMLDSKPTLPNCRKSPRTEQNSRLNRTSILWVSSTFSLFVFSLGGGGNYMYGTRRQAQIDNCTIDFCSRIFFEKEYGQSTNPPNVRRPGIRLISHKFYNHWNWAKTKPTSLMAFVPWVLASKQNTRKPVLSPKLLVFFYNAHFEQWFV